MCTPRLSELSCQMSFVGCQQRTLASCCGLGDRVAGVLVICGTPYD